jgi:hypothetical protein
MVSSAYDPEINVANSNTPASFKLRWDFLVIGDEGRLLTPDVFIQTSIAIVNHRVFSPSI